MTRKIIVFCLLAVIAMQFSSCIVVDGGGHRHWGWHHHHHHYHR